MAYPLHGVGGNRLVEGPQNRAHDEYEKRITHLSPSIALLANHLRAIEELRDHVEKTERAIQRRSRLARDAPGQKRGGAFAQGKGSSP